MHMLIKPPYENRLKHLTTLIRPTKIPTKLRYPYQQIYIESSENVAFQIIQNPLRQKIGAWFWGALTIIVKVNSLSCYLLNSTAFGEATFYPRSALCRPPVGDSNGEVPPLLAATTSAGAPVCCLHHAAEGL